MLYNKAYELDFYKLGIQLLPALWRTRVQVLYVKLISVPFNWLLRRLRKYRDAQVYKLQHSASLGRLQKVANDHFDPAERRIEVVMNPDRKNPLYTFFPEENRPKLFTYFPDENQEPLYTFFPDETSEFVADFYVLVPAVIGLIESEINRLDYLIWDYAKKDKHFVIKII